jgi:tRNA A-37 threonylcarbamoyl transferase component Bud32/tetratricopeptide (TPR) repeat protein
MTDPRAQLQQIVGATYAIERELGGGGMSRVYLAKETALGRTVVIKVLPPEMSAAVNVERFVREIQLAARLQHPHVVSMLTAASTGELLYYVMPYISGESLRAKLEREGALPVPEALRYLREIVDALAYAHAQNVVHRDIKPDNVLLSTGHAVVTDFGVAKAVTASSGGHSSLTSLGVALGTPAYMAPEQAAADPHVDHRADIYAVGVMAYEMLAGRTPFTSATPQAMLAAHITKVPEPLIAHRSAIPAALNTIVMKCLEKHPADRFQTAGDLLAQLETVLTPSGGLTPSEAMPPVSSGTAEALKKSAPVRVIAAFAAASIATLAVVWVAVQQLGLPTWVFYGAIILLIIGLPIILTTGYFERKRAVARATGTIIPPNVSGVHRHFTWRKAIRGGMLAFAGLAVLAIVYTVMRLTGIGPVGTLVAAGRLNEKDQILVADFENRTSDSSLGSSITEAFRIDLAQTPVVRVLTTAQINDGLRRMERAPGAPVVGTLAQELAARAGAKVVVAGEVSLIGRSYVLAARIVNAADGAELVALRETAETDAGIVAALDRLSGRVRERLGESLKSIRGSEPLEQVTTASLEALRLYSEATHLNDIGEAGRAVTVLEQALALDSGFAMGWRKLAVALGNSQASQERIVDATSRAYQYRERLTELERQLTTAYYYTNVDWDPAKVEAAYRKVMAISPGHYIATNNLALALLNQPGRAAEAESLVSREATTADHPTNAMSQLLLAQMLQDTTRVRRTLSGLVQRFPGSSMIQWMNEFILSGLQDFSAAERAVASYALQSRDPEDQGRALWDQSGVATTQGRIAEGERLARQAIAVNEQRGLRGVALGQRVFSAWVRIQVVGDTAAGLRELTEALQRYPLDSIPKYDRPLGLIAAVYASMGRLSEARSALARYEADLPAGYRRGVPEWHVARGMVALGAGDAAGAVTAFTEARTAQFCLDCTEYLIGFAAERAGQPDSAVAAYRRAAATGSVWKVNYDALFLAASFRRLGELYEERKDNTRALDYYGRFTALWKEADPLLQPQVREVKARMARLAGEPK